MQAGMQAHWQAGVQAEVQASVQVGVKESCACPQEELVPRLHPAKGCL